MYSMLSQSINLYDFSHNFQGIELLVTQILTIERMEFSEKTGSIEFGLSL